MPNINFPLAVVVSIFAPCPVRTLKPIFLLVRSWIILIKCFKLLPNLSNFQTTKISPSLRSLRQFSRPGLSSLFPEILS